MARRTFDVIDVTEILMHWHAGRSKSEMAESLGVDRKTLRKYIAPAGVRMSAIHQRLRDEHALAVSPASFRRCVAANVPEETRSAQVVVWNPRPTEAGGEAQIDYGAGLLTAHVRAAGAEDGPAGLNRMPRRGVRVLRRRPGPAGPGQSQDRGGQAGSLRPRIWPNLPPVIMSDAITCV